MSDEPIVMTELEAAAALRLEPAQLHDLVKAGTVPVVRLVDGGPDLFRPADLRAVVLMATEGSG